MGRRKNGSGGGWETAGGDKGAATARKVRKRNADQKNAALQEAKQRELLMKLPHWQQGVIGINAPRSSSSSDSAGGWQSVGKGGDVKLNSKQRRQLARKAKQEAFAREQAELARRQQDESAPAEPLLQPWDEPGQDGSSQSDSLGADARVSTPPAPSTAQHPASGIRGTVATVALTLLVVALALYLAKQQGLVRLNV